MKKIINRNKPDIGDDGQYNYEDGTIVGIQGNNELYTIQKNHSNSDEYADDFPAGGIGPSGKGLLTIDYLQLRRMISSKSYKNDYRLYIVDGNKAPLLNAVINPVDNSYMGSNPYNKIKNALDTLNQQGMWKRENCTGDGCQDGGYFDHYNSSGWNPPCLIGTNCSYNFPSEFTGKDAPSEIDGFPYPEIETVADFQEIDNWAYVFDHLDMDGSINESGGRRLAEAMAYQVDPLNYPADSFYFVLYCRADHWGWDWNRSRDKSYTVYRLPKSILWDMWFNPDSTSRTIKWGGSGGDYQFNRPSYVKSNDGTWTAQWAGGDLEMTITGPSADYWKSEGNQSQWIDDTSDTPFYFNLDPEAYVDYFNVDINFTTEDITLPNLDFRAVSFLNVKNSPYDLQEFHRFPKNAYTSAPNTVQLSFRIAENFDVWYPSYIGYNPDEPLQTEIENEDGEVFPITDEFSGLKFKFFVFDWEADDMELQWDDIISEIPNDVPDYWREQNSNNIYIYQDLYNEDGTYNNLEHEYISAGMKIIKAVIFSYVYDTSNTYIQGIRWKAVAVRIFLNEDSAYVEDFSELGGNDFTYLPWPQTVPIMSGISNDSQYVNSLYRIVQKNLFDENEVLEESRTFDAYENINGGKQDELGDYMGKSDISQMRYFTEVYNMNDLIMLPLQNQNFVRYDEYDQWYQFSEELMIDNGKPKYPEESCVGMIFINDDPNKDRRDNCIMEFNFSDVDTNNIIRDSSGHGFKGILIGDYALRKATTGIPTSRDSSLDVPITGEKKKAF